ncbi:MAG TPA: MBL fold metallo-hydrolase [Gammaproteobacteria bacterium]|nr:MBL fold metallo-hydrolase [Gammaproteobacteria bacterium]
MRAHSWIVGVVVVFAASLLGAGAVAAQDNVPKVTVLYDAFGKDPALEKDWGYAALIEVNGQRILFDTGNNGDILEKNARARNIDLSRLDFVVMSHRHGDHIGGLAFLLEINPTVKIFAPKEGFGVFGADLPSSFYPKDPTLPAEQRYFDGEPPEVMRFGSAWPAADFELIDKDTEIATNVHVIAQVSQKTGTLELRELSLAVNTDQGLIVLVGCSHSGVENIVAAASKINPSIQLLAGGFHLIQGKAEELAAVITALRDTHQVAYVAPGHCTGELTFTALTQAFGDRYLYAGLGTTFEIGDLVRAVEARNESVPSALDYDDFRELREHLAMSNDVEHILLARGIEHHHQAH